VPNLRTIFAYEVIFDAHARELFAGIFDEVKREVDKRVKDLAKKWHNDDLGEVASETVDAPS